MPPDPMMAANDLVLVALLSGLCTYLIRFLPLAAADRLNRLGPRLNRFLLALGPSAIAALLALSVADLLPATRQGPAVAALTAGVAAVLATHRLTANPAWATLAGAAAYGLAAAWWGL